MPKKQRPDVARLRDLARAKSEARSDAKKVMVVSNRSDRPLQQSLAKKLGAKITWVVGKPRRIQSAAKAVGSGGFDTLILFTGFLDHKVVGIMLDAARKSETPVVRANRGRMKAIEQAMERDLKNETDGTDEPEPEQADDADRAGQDSVG
jgi:hypothetical protein